VPPVAIDRTHRVKNKLRGKRPGAGGHGTPGGTSARILANFIQLAHYGRSARAMNRPVDAASAAQARISRVHDRVNGDPGDVADDQAELLAALEIDLHIAIVKVETIPRTRAL
jgi:hypothetical protein